MIKPGIKRIIVVGGNAAGAAAAAKAKRTNQSADVIMYEQSGYISTGTCEMPYALSGEVTDAEQLLFYTPNSFLAEKGVTVKVHHTVEKINRKSKRIIVRDNVNNTISEIEYDSLILATGGTVPELVLDDKVVQNAKKLKSYSDLLVLKKIISEITQTEEGRVVIFGAGYIGLELAESFTSLGFKVLLLDSTKVPFFKAEPEISHFVSELLKQNGITYFSLTEPELKYFFNGNSLAKVKVGGYLYNVDLLINATGVIPKTELAMSAGIELQGNKSISVDNRCKTSDNYIYAAGDCISSIHGLTKKSFFLPLATVARSSGYIAGANAAGGYEKRKEVIPNVTVRLFNRFIGTVGLTEKECTEYNIPFQSVTAATHNKPKIMPDAILTFGKLIIHKHTKELLGASFFGGYEVSNYSDIVMFAIQNRLKSDSLTNGDYSYTPSLSAFNNLLSILGKKLAK